MPSALGEPATPFSPAEGAPPVSAAMETMLEPMRTTKATAVVPILRRIAHSIINWPFTATQKPRVGFWIARLLPCASRGRLKSSTPSATVRAQPHSRRRSRAWRQSRSQRRQRCHSGAFSHIVDYLVAANAGWSCRPHCPGLALGLSDSRKERSRDRAGLATAAPSEPAKTGSRGADRKVTLVLGNWPSNTV
jgi:hypothetical protein